MNIPPGPRKQPSVSPPGQVQGQPQLRTPHPFTTRPTPPVNIRPQVPEAFEGSQLQYQRYSSRFSQSPSNFPHLGTSPHQHQAGAHHPQQPQPPQQLQIQSVRPHVAVLSPDSSHLHSVYYQSTGTPAVSSNQQSSSPSHPQTIQIQTAQPVVYSGQPQPNFGSAQGQGVFSGPHPGSQGQGQQPQTAQQSYTNQQPHFQQHTAAFHPRQRPPTPQQSELQVNQSHPSSQPAQPQVFISQAYSQGAGPHDISKAPLGTTVPPRGQTPPQSALAPGIMQYTPNPQQQNQRHPAQGFVPRSMSQTMSGQRPTRPINMANNQIFQQQFPGIMMPGAQLSQQMGQQIILQQPNPNPIQVQYPSASRMQQPFTVTSQQQQQYHNPSGYYQPTNPTMYMSQTQAWSGQQNMRMPTTQQTGSAPVQNNYPAKRERKTIKITDPTTGADVNLEDMAGGPKASGTPPQSDTPNSRGTPVSQQQTGQAPPPNANASIAAQFATQVAATLSTDKSAGQPQEVSTPPQQGQQLPPGAPPQHQMVAPSQTQLPPMSIRQSMPPQQNQQMPPQGVSPARMVSVQQGVLSGQQKSSIPQPVIHQQAGMGAPTNIVVQVPGGPGIHANQRPVQQQPQVTTLTQQQGPPPAQSQLQTEQVQKPGQPQGPSHVPGAIQESQKAGAPQVPTLLHEQHQDVQQQQINPAPPQIPQQTATTKSSQPAQVMQGPPQQESAPTQGQPPIPAQEPVVRPQSEQAVFGKPEALSVGAKVIIADPVQKIPEPTPTSSQTSRAIEGEPSSGQVPQYIQQGPATQVPQPVQKGPATQVPQPVQKGPAPQVPQPVQKGPATQVPQLVQKGPAAQVPQPVQKGPAAQVPQLVQKGPAAQVPQLVQKGPATQVPQLVQKGPATQVPQPVQKGPATQVPRPVQKGPATQQTTIEPVEVAKAPVAADSHVTPTVKSEEVEAKCDQTKAVTAPVPLPQREDSKDRRKKPGKYRARELNQKGEGSDMDAFTDGKEGNKSSIETSESTNVDGASAAVPKEQTPELSAPSVETLNGAAPSLEKPGVVTPQEKPLGITRDKSLTPTPQDQPKAVSLPDKPETVVAPQEAVESVASQDEQRRVAERNEKNSKEHSKMEESKEPSSENQDNHIEDSKIDKTEMPVIKKDKMELKYKYREDQWSPLNPEGKKLYDRSFLLQLQYSSESMEKPDGLPQLPEVVLETPIPSRNEKQFGQTQSSNSKSFEFTPAYVMANFGGKPPLHKSNSRQKPPRGGSSQGDQRKVISIHIQEVKLHHTTNAWQAGVKKEVKGEAVSADENEELFRKIRSILNKLTPQKFQKLLNQVIELGINTEEKLAGTIDITFEKAISEPSFSVAYANLCKCLSNVKVPQTNNPEQFVMFRKLLLNRCQKEFEKDKAEALGLEEMQRAIDEAPADKKKELKALKDQAETKARKRSLGNIRFIGELFKLRMLTESIMHDCLLKLLRAQDDDSLEALCNLLRTIGKDLDVDKSKQKVEQYYSQLNKLVDSKKYSSRLRFMMLDAIDLRKNDWVPRREDNAPKTIEQIHKEAHHEEQQKKITLQNVPHDHKGRGRGGRGSQSGGSRGSQQGDDGWTPVKPARAPSIDPSKMKITKHTMDENNISLGRPGGFGAWGRGSSGGTKQASKESERPSGPGNRYSLLSGGGGGGSTAPAESAEPVRHGMGRGGMYASGRDGKSGGGRLSQGRDRGQLTSRPSQEQEREAALAAARNITTARSTSGSRVPGGSRNQSRDNSRNRSSRDNSRNRGPSRDRSADKRPSRTAQELPIEEIEKKSRALMDEYLHIHDLKEALQCLTELESPQSIHLSVGAILTHVLERSDKARKMSSHLLHEAIKQKVITPDNYTQGLITVLEYADDMAIDIPQIWKYLGELIGPMIEDGIWHVSNLKAACVVLLPFNKAGVLVSHVLHDAAHRLGTIKVAELWRTAKMSWSDFLPNTENQKDFLIREKLEFTVEEEPPKSPEASTMPIDIVQKGLENLIIDKEAHNEMVFDWINANVLESRTREPPFIRALMSVVCQSAIVGQVTSCKVESERIKKRCILLQRYLDHDAKLELQALYALQALVHKLEHPPEVLRVFFDTLYDEDIISEDAFYQWEGSKDPAEQAGKGVAVSSVVQFFTWLREAEEDDPDAANK